MKQKTLTIAVACALSSLAAAGRPERGFLEKIAGHHEPCQNRPEQAQRRAGSGRLRQHQLRRRERPVDSLRGKVPEEYEAARAGFVDDVQLCARGLEFA